MYVSKSQCHHEPRARGRIADQQESTWGAAQRNSIFLVRKLASSGAQIKCVYTQAHSTGINKRSWRHAHACRAMILPASQKHGGMAPMSGVLEWKDIGCRGRTGRADKEHCQWSAGVHGALSVDRWEANREFIGQDKREGRVKWCYSGGSATGCLTRKTPWMRPSHLPLSWWRTLTTLTPVGVTQKTKFCICSNSTTCGILNISDVDKKIANKNKADYLEVYFIHES